MRLLSLPALLLTLVAASHASGSISHDNFNEGELARRSYSGSAGQKGFEIRRRSMRKHQSLIARGDADQEHAKRLLAGVFGNDSSSKDEGTDSESDSSGNAKAASSSTDEEGEDESTTDPDEDPDLPTTARLTTTASRRRSSTVASTTRSPTTTARLTPFEDGTRTPLSSTAQAASSSRAAARLASLARVSLASESSASVAALSSASLASVSSELAASEASVSSVASARSASSASAATAAAASRKVQDALEASATAVLVTSSVSGGVTVITSYETANPTGIVGSTKAATTKPSEPGLSKASIVAIAASLGTIGLIAIVFTIIRKRQQALSRAIRPLDFNPTPAYGATDDTHSTHRGVTRTSQESWLGGRPMSGVSQFDPDALPPMVEHRNSDNRGMGEDYYEGGGAAILSAPPNVLGSSKPLRVDSNVYTNAAYAREAQTELSNGGNPAAYYDGSAAGGYHPTAVRGDDLAHHAQAVGSATSPYANLQRGPSSSGHSSGSYSDPVYAVAYGGESEVEDPFQYPSQSSRNALSTERWSG